jgi:hypothetical protein
MITEENKKDIYAIIDAMPDKEKAYWTVNESKPYDWVIQNHVNSLEAYNRGASWSMTIGDNCNSDIIEYLRTKTAYKNIPRSYFNPS